MEWNGVRFRVWAPDVERAVVAYDNKDDPDSTAKPLEYRDGLWQGFVDFNEGIKAGSRYKFVFRKNGQWFERIDPAARNTEHSAIFDRENHGYVEYTGHPWPPFRTPSFENLIIYQLHIGSFAGFNDDFAGQVVDQTATFKMIASKLGYIRDLGFNAIQLLPVQEYRMNRSWGYDPSFFFAIESAYGTPEDLRNLVAEAHRHELAVLFDVVYNHATRDEPNNSIQGWPTYGNARGEYLDPNFDSGFGWGPGPAFYKERVREFFIENARMYFEDYQADGLRLDHTRTIEANSGLGNNGWRFLQELAWKLKQNHADKYLVAEHLPDHDSIVRDAGLNATWFSQAHHEFQRAAQGDGTLRRLKSFLGKDFGFGRNYPNQWNLVKYLLGSHDECGDADGGKSIDDSDDSKRHRYFVEFFGGRNNWYARAKARLGWALNIAIPGTPLLFMGLECHHWGYWDEDDGRRFNWAIAGDPIAMEMRKLVTAANWVRWQNPALRSETFDITHEDYTNTVLAFKRYSPGANNCVLTIVNMGETNFTDFSYGVYTGGQGGRWTQILCTQDRDFGGWDGAGNAFHEPWTQADGKVYINLPKWSVIMLRLQ